MNSIGNLLTRYALENLASGFRMHNCSFPGPKSAANDYSPKNEAVKVELGKDNQKCRMNPKVYGPASRFRRSCPKTTTTNLNAPKETPEKTHPMEDPQPKEQLDFKGFQQMNFKEFMAAWGAKDGEAGYNATYDSDSNGVIDMVDWLAFGREMQNSFEQFKLAYGATATDGNYNDAYDYDKNGVVDMVDWLAFGKNWIA